MKQPLATKFKVNAVLLNISCKKLDCMESTYLEAIGNNNFLGNILACVTNFSRK
jgi:hypothetical protein